MRTSVASTFLNVDLDLFAGVPFPRLAHELGRELFELHRDVRADGIHWARFESNLADVRGPAEPVADFVRAVEALSPEARHEWDALTERRLFFGYDHRRSAGPFSEVLSADVVALAARLGASVEVIASDPSP